AVHRGLTFMTMNSAAGIANNVQSVGYLADRATGQIAGAPIQAYKREYPAWLQENGLTKSSDNHRRFMREVQQYATDMYWDGTSPRQSAALQRVFEHEEFGTKAALDWLKDTKHGKTPVR